MPSSKIQINEVEFLKTRTLKFLFGKYPKLLFNDIQSNYLFTGSGRASLRLILEYLKTNKTLVNRNSPMLVPPWLCDSVLCTMNKFCSPTQKNNTDIKGILVFHQFGYPQKMEEICDHCEDNDLFLIEDCANAYKSFYRGKRIGTFGDASIFSFSKIFPSLLGGALITNNESLFLYSERRIKTCRKSTSVLTYSGRLFYECFKDSPFSPQTHIGIEMMYGIIDSAFDIRDISLRVINHQLSTGKFDERKKNYDFLLNYFKDRPELFCGLEKEKVIPYIVPVFSDLEKMKMIAERLSKAGIYSGIYHFDVNRNILNPFYEKCVVIPIHQGIRREQMDLICGTIEDVCH